jgi:molybdate transport system substrate-binding protein
MNEPGRSFCRRPGGPTVSALWLMAVFVVVAGCRGSDRPTIVVAAASDLAPVFEELTATIEDSCKVELRVTLGSSGLLANQVSAGAPYDVYLSADAQFPMNLRDRGLAARDEVVEYAVGRIVIAWREGVEPMESLEALAASPVSRIAIANPEHAPYGRAAEEALRKSGIYGAVAPRLVIGENIRQTYDYVRGGNADAGIVAISLVAQTDRPFALLDASLHEPITQVGMIVADRPNQSDSWCVLNYFRSSEGQGVLHTYGFESLE